MMNRVLEDAELLTQLRRGESRAMAMLYDRYARLVFSLAVKILNDRAGAEEVVQEVFVKVWRRARDYDAARGKFSSWLTGITHNHAIDELRRRRTGGPERGSRPHPVDAILRKVRIFLDEF